MFEGLDEFILKRLQKKVTEKGLNNYETFGKNVEDPVSDLVEQYLENKGVGYTAKRAKNKNKFPDLELTIDDITYAFEHKAGASDKDPENDLGTLNVYDKKIKKYEDNIYCIFVKYSKASKSKGITIDAIYFDKIYTFIGKRADEEGILKYRKKDGNLRPKSWKDFSSGRIYFNNLNKFKEAINKTIIYRAEQLVEQHIESLDKYGLERVYNKIGKMINNLNK